jgi:hypothetical protein
MHAGSALVLVLALAAQAADDLGVNLDRNADYSTAQTWVDVRNLFRKWGQPDKPWLENPELKLTADGYPLADAGTLTYLKAYPDGVYHLSYEGTGEVEVKGMGRLEAPIDASKSVKTGRVVVAHAKNPLLILNIRNVDPQDPIRKLRLICPDYPPDTAEVFTAEFLRRVGPFAALRFLDWTQANDSPVARWDDRTRPESFLRTGPAGVAWEDVIALANRLDKDIWINVPDQADDDYVRQLARLLKATLHPGVRVYVEHSNELWNSQFRQTKRNREAALADSSLGASNPTHRAAERAAARLVAIGAIFREEFGKEGPRRVATVLAGQAANDAYLKAGLNYLQARHGEPRRVIGAVAVAAYLALAPKTEQPEMSVDDLFAELARARVKIVEQVRAHRQLAATYRLPLLAYEGGQHLVAANPVARAELNVESKRAAQDDPRMGRLLEGLVTDWHKAGGGLFVHYSHIRESSKSGYWGLLETTAQPGSVKWDAVMGLAVPGGDATLDGTVDYRDFVVLKNHYQKGTSAGDRLWWEQGDFDHDGRVGPADLKILSANLGPLTSEQAADYKALAGKAPPPAKAKGKAGRGRAKGR